MNSNTFLIALQISEWYYAKNQECIYRNYYISIIKQLTKQPIVAS